ncbi:MAG: hypothetical protein ACRC2O_13680, partial [Chitinophagaceae bacterium]
MTKMKFNLNMLFFALTVFLFASCTSNENKPAEEVKVASASTGPDRTVLPFAVSEYKGKIDSF